MTREEVYNSVVEMIKDFEMFESPITEDSVVIDLLDDDQILVAELFDNISDAHDVELSEVFDNEDFDIDTITVGNIVDAVVKEVKMKFDKKVVRIETMTRRTVDELNRDVNRLLQIGGSAWSVQETKRLPNGQYQAVVVKRRTIW